MIRYIAIEQEYMHEKIIAITGRFASLYVYDTTILAHDGGPCRELTFIRNVTEKHVRGPDGYNAGIPVFDESGDSEAIALGRALCDLEESGEVRECDWTQLENDPMFEYPSQRFAFEPRDFVDSLPYVKFKGRGRAAVADVAKYLQCNWQDCPLPWETNNAESANV